MNGFLRSFDMSLWSQAASLNAVAFRGKAERTCLGAMWGHLEMNAATCQAFNVYVRRSKRLAQARSIICLLIF